jgi:hypothetical protein
MKQSETIIELSKAMAKAQDEMGGAVKNSNNPFFKSSYADLTSVIKAIKEPFANNGLSFVQFPINGDHSIGVVTRLMHESGEWLESEYILPLVKNDPQSAGSVITYARRYSLASMCGIPAVDDDAEMAMVRGKSYISERQYDELLDLIEQSNTDLDKFRKAFAIESLGDMETGHFTKAKSMLKRKIEQANVKAETEKDNASD